MNWVNAPKNEVADHERAKWERLAQKLRDHAKKQFKVDLNEAKKSYGITQFPTFYGFCMNNGIDELDLDDVIDSSYDSDTGEFELVPYVKKAIKKLSIKDPVAKEKALKIIHDAAKFTITGKGPGRKKAERLLDKFAAAAYSHLVTHWENLNEDLDEGLKDFGKKVLNKVMGVPDGEHKYKVGDTVKFEMSPGQAGGSGTGKIEKLLKGHHYLINGKPVNQNEIKSKVAAPKDEEPRRSISGDSLRYQEMRRDLPGRFEAVAEPIKKFTKGQKVKVKKTGEEVEVISQNDIGLVFTASKDAVKIPNDKKLKIVPGKGYQEYMPRELQEMRVDELSVDTLASYRDKRLKQRGEVFAKDPYATPKGPKDPLSDKVHTGVHRAYRKELHGKSVEANKKDPGRGSIQRQYYSGESGSRSGD
jgi:hypothetical protein